MENWSQHVREEMEAVLAARVASANVMWETGEVSDEAGERVTPDFVGAQYAPWYEGGVWRAGAAEWSAGNEKAAAFYGGKGIHWTMDQITVLPRTLEEAAVMLRISHWTSGQSRPAEALFLETWVKRDGDWHLLRHVAEKARALQDH